MPDEKQHEFDPDTCPGCATYVDKYGHADLARNLDAEEANLHAARWQANLAWPAADPATSVSHRALHDPANRRPKQTLAGGAVRPNAVLGRPRRPTTEGRVRPSDEDKVN